LFKASSYLRFSAYSYALSALTQIADRPQTSRLVIQLFQTDAEMFWFCQWDQSAMWILL